MSRREREAKLKALYAEDYPAVLVSQMGGRKRDRKKLLTEEMDKKAIEGSYQFGSLPAIAVLSNTGIDPNGSPSPPPGGAAPALSPLTPSGPMTVGTKIPGLAANMQGKPWWRLRMRGLVTGANPFNKSQSIYGNAAKQIQAGTHTFRQWPDQTAAAGYQKGSLPDFSSGFASLPVQAKRLEERGADPGWMLRKMMNAPATLAGLGLGLAKGASFGPGPGDTIIAEYDETDPFRQDAQTLGEVILRRRGMLPGVRDKITEHELGHVEQGKLLGPLLPAASGVAALVQALRGKDPYLENPFETTAPQIGAEAMRRALVR
jgi:hypothetical protein